MNKRLMKIILLITVFIVLVTNVFPDYTIRVKIKDAWTEYINHPAETDTYCGPCEQYADPPEHNCSDYQYTIVVKEAWTETVNHPAQYATVTIKGEKPDDIDVPDEMELDEFLGTYWDTPQPELETMLTTGNIDTDVLSEYNEEFNLDYITPIENEHNNIVNGETVRDPVRVSTGEFVVTQNDFSYNFFNNTISIKRYYNSNSLKKGSFGKSWQFNYDTRIIRCYDQFAINEIGTIRGKYNNVDSKYISDVEFNIKITNIDNEIKRVTAIQTKLNSIKRQLQQSGYSDKQVIKNEIKKVDDKLIPVNSYISSLNRNRTDSIRIHNEHKTLRTKLGNLLNNYDNRVKLANSNISKNKYGNIIIENQTQLYSGNDKIILIDENGVLNIYYIDIVPDYNSTVLYPDGSINYYPSGSTTTSCPIKTETLFLKPDGSYILTKKNKSIYYYSFYGLLEKIEDRNGNIINFVYDVNNKLIKVVDGIDRETVIERNADGNIIKTIDPSGMEFNYTYDPDGYLFEVIDPMNYKTSFLYDGNLISEIVKPDGASRKYEYRTDRRIDYYTDEEGAAEYFEYNLQENYTEYTNECNKKRFYFNEKAQTTKILHEDGSEELKFYDDDGNMIKYINCINETYEYKYDEYKHVTEIIYPDGLIEKFEYNDFGHITAYTDRKQNEYIYIYDVEGNLIRKIFPDKSVIEYKYNANGLIVETKDQLGCTTSFEYDENGYLTNVYYPDSSFDSYDNNEIGRIESFTDKAGNKTSFEYDKNNNIIKINYPDDSFKEYKYNNRNKVSEIIDANGNSTILEYNKRRDLIKITTCEDVVKEYAYNINKKIISSKIDDISSYVYDFDLLGNRTLIKEDSIGILNERVYDSSGQLKEEIDGNGNRTEYLYDSLGRMTVIRNAKNEEVVLEYDENGNLKKILDAKGNPQEFEYDNMNRLIKITDAVGNIKKFEYDLKGNLIKKIDPKGNITSYKYDSMGRLYESIDPDNNKNCYEFDANGNIIKKIDARGNNSQFVYDNMNRLVEKINSLGLSKKFIYDSNGNLTQSKDENDNITKFYYDKMNRLIESENPYGSKNKITYNSLDKIVLMENDLGGRTSFRYNSIGKLINVTDAFDYDVNMEYDNAGNLLKYIDQYNNETLYEYDELNRKIAVIDAFDDRTSFEYDENGNLISVIDPKGNKYSYQYNEINKMISEINRIGNEKSYSYDANSNLEVVTDFNGNIINYEYDNLNRLVSMSTDGINNTYSYDANGNIVNAENEDSKLSYTYDALNRISRLTDEILNTSADYFYDNTGNLKLRRTRWNTYETRSTFYIYGAINELKKVSDGDGAITKYYYDKAGRLLREVRPNGFEIHKSYDLAGRTRTIKTIKSQNFEIINSIGYLYDKRGKIQYKIEDTGDITQYQYDKLGRIMNVYYPFLSGKPEADFAERIKLGLYSADNHQDNHNKYTFNIPDENLDDFNSLDLINIKNQLKHYENVTREYQNLEGTEDVKWQIDIDCGTGFVNNLKVNVYKEYELHDLYQEITGSTDLLDLEQRMWKETFYYDENSNLRTKMNGWGRNKYYNNEENQLIRAGNIYYSYDKNGNMTEQSFGDIKSVYKYNKINRLTDIYNEIEGFIGNYENRTKWYRGLAGGQKYTYDAFGRRNTEVEYAIDGTAELINNESFEEYLHDGFGLNVVQEFVKSDTYSFQPKSENVYARNKILTKTDFNSDDGQIKKTNKFFYHQDIQNSTIMTSNNSGLSYRKYNYDVYGNLINGQFIDGEEYGFTGKEIDMNTGLSNYGFRDYSPRMHRFTTSDPIKDGFNWYAYCGGDPVNKIDLFGLCEEDNVDLGINLDSQILIVDMPGIINGTILDGLERNEAMIEALRNSRNDLPIFDRMQFLAPENAEELEQGLISWQNSMNEQGVEEQSIIFTGAHGGDHSMYGFEHVYGGTSHSVYLDTHEINSNDINVDLNDNTTVVFETCVQGLHTDEWSDSLGIPNENVIGHFIPEYMPGIERIPDDGSTNYPAVMNTFIDDFYENVFNGNDVAESAVQLIEDNINYDSDGTSWGHVSIDFNNYYYQDDLYYLESIIKD